MQGELTINKSRGGRKMKASKSKLKCKTCCQMQLCFGDLHSDAEVMGGFSVFVIRNFFSGLKKSQFFFSVVSQFEDEKVVGRHSPI